MGPHALPCLLPCALSIMQSTCENPRVSFRAEAPAPTGLRAAHSSLEAKHTSVHSGPANTIRRPGSALGGWPWLLSIARLERHRLGWQGGRDARGSPLLTWMQGQNDDCTQQLLQMPQQRANGQSVSCHAQGQACRPAGPTGRWPSNGRDCQARGRGPPSVCAGSQNAWLQESVVRGVQERGRGSTPLARRLLPLVSKHQTVDNPITMSGGSSGREQAVPAEDGHDAQQQSPGVGVWVK